MDTDELFRLLAAFDKVGLEYALIGGAALNLHGIVRATEDVDLMIRASEENVARLKTALRELYADPEIDNISPADLLGDYPAVRYYPPDEGLFLDILTRLGEASSYEDLEIEQRVIAGVPVRLASAASLYHLKKDTVRPIDRLDAEILRDRFGLDGEDPEP